MGFNSHLKKFLSKFGFYFPTCQFSTGPSKLFKFLEIVNPLPSLGVCAFYFHSKNPFYISVVRIKVFDVKSLLKRLFLEVSSTGSSFDWPSLVPLLPDLLLKVNVILI